MSQNATRKNLLLHPLYCYENGGPEASLKVRWQLACDGAQIMTQDLWFCGCPTVSLCREDTVSPNLPMKTPGTGKVLVPRILCVISLNLHQGRKWQNRWHHSTNPQVASKTFPSSTLEDAPTPSPPDTPSSPACCLVCQALVSSASRAVLTTTQLYHHEQQYQESLGA